MKRRCVIENCIGETRAAVYEGRKLVELYVRRETDASIPRQGDVFAGRVSKIDQSLGGAFINIGVQHDGLFKFTNSPNAPRFTEGQMAEFEVSKATEIGKGPVLKFKQLTKADKVGKLSGDDLKTTIAKRFDGIEFTEATVSVIDEATETELAIKGGGTIAIERTRALVAIDVDKGTAVSSFDVCITYANPVSAIRFSKPLSELSKMIPITSNSRRSRALARSNSRAISPNLPLMKF